jgi:hypothetical protein
MKYCFLTNLNILTPSIESKIYQLLDYNRSFLTLTSQFNEYSQADTNHRYLQTIKSQNELDTYKKYKEKLINSTHYSKLKPLSFDVHKLPDNLEKEIFNQLPLSIKNMNHPPYIRLQTMYGGDYLFPHSDAERTATLICVVSDNLETTWWWRQLEPHSLPGNTMPDIDRIEKSACARAAKGETWLFDVHEIHSVERETGHHNDRRITINFRWSNVSTDEIIKLIV